MDRSRSASRVRRGAGGGTARLAAPAVQRFGTRWQRGFSPDSGRVANRRARDSISERKGHEDRRCSRFHHGREPRAWPRVREAGARAGCAQGLRGRTRSGQRDAAGRRAREARRDRSGGGRGGRRGGAGRHAADQQRRHRAARQPDRRRRGRCIARTPGDQRVRDAGDVARIRGNARGPRRRRDPEHPVGRELDEPADPVGLRRIEIGRMGADQRAAPFAARAARG